VVPVQPTGELRQEGVLGIGSDPFDHELLPGDAQGEGGSFLEEVLRPPRYPSCGGCEGGMPLRIHGVLVEGDRQLDEEIG
jgi:hypothetical protein